MAKNHRCVYVLGWLLLFGMVVPVCGQSAQKLTLREAVTLALQNSRELKLARMQYTVALNEAAVGRGEFRPNLYAGSGAAYTSGYPSVPGGGLPSLFNLAYSQSIFNPSLKGQVQSAEDRAKNSKLEIDQTQDDVIVRTATAYLDLANVRHSLELMRSEQSSADKILEVIRERVAANQELPIEVTRAELTLARTRQRIIKLEDREEILYQQLRDVTGIPEGHAIEVDNQQPNFATDQQDNDLLSLAVQHDRGIQEAENERTARQDILRGARGEYWPTVSVIGEYQVLARFNNYKLYFNPNAPFQRNEVVAGVQVTIPIFSAKTRANIALAKSQLNSAELSLGNKRQQVRLDVEQKTRSVREQDVNREVARLDLKLSQETVEVVQARFDQSRATLEELEQARLDENDKWVAFLDADFARQQDQLLLLQATGQLAKVFQ
jgi:outer membrane protein